nr:hypothetical protein Clen_400 [Cedratvirus lena]WIL04568.1 hypothetical protein Cduv_88 [Cedratvirus duvanny]
MNSILFSVMCCSETKDLFTLSSVCEETRTIFTSKSFWKERFALLGIQHKEPSLQVYLRFLKIERRLLNARPQTIFYIEIDLELARKFMHDQHVKELIDNIDRAKKEGRPGKHGYFLEELRLMLSSYMVVEAKENKYSFAYNATRAFPPPDKLSRIEMLNVLLRLCPNP